MEEEQNAFTMSLFTQKILSKNSCPLNSFVQNNPASSIKIALYSASSELDKAKNLALRTQEKNHNAASLKTALGVTERLKNEKLALENSLHEIRYGKQSFKRLWRPLEHPRFDSIFPIPQVKIGILTLFLAKILNFWKI